MEKKQNQLGMNPSTASAKLIKDLLFNFAIQNGHKCYRCGGGLLRENFSIEHVVPWLDSEDPVKLYFDIDNIAYSHLSCNISAKRKPSYSGKKGKFTHGTSGYRIGCRCSVCKTKYSADRRQRYIRLK